MVLRQRLRSFVERLDFVTSVGHRYGADSRAEFGYPGAGPTAVITDLGTLRPDPETKELTLVALHPARPARQNPSSEKGGSRMRSFTYDALLGRVVFGADLRRAQLVRPGAGRATDRYVAGEASR